MIDITKEEFWENNESKITKCENSDNILKKFINKHKIITMLLLALGLLMIANVILVYNFFRIITTI